MSQQAFICTVICQQKKMIKLRAAGLVRYTAPANAFFFSMTQTAQCISLYHYINLNGKLQCRSQVTDKSQKQT